MKIESFPREIWAWALYDFANSSYSTALAGVIFNVYFVQVVVGPQGISLFGSQITSSAVWGYVVSFSMLAVAVSAPVLGAIADHNALKKKFLLVFCYLGVLSTSLLFLVSGGDVWLAIIFYVVSSMTLEWSLVFYNGFLPEIASRERMGRISGLGWAVGYVGGVLCLIVNLAIIERPGWFGLPIVDNIPVRSTFLVVALWWGLFSIPTFLWLPERACARPLSSGAGYVKTGLRNLLTTLRKINQYRELGKFLIAFLIYNDGVQTVIVMAAVFGAQVLEMSQKELILCFILIHMVAFVGSLVFGYLSDKRAIKTSLHICLLIWTGVVLYVVVIDQIWEFWVLGTIVGFALGGIQACSRALLAQFTPSENSAEFFGFFATSGKFAAILGPVLFAVLTDLTGTPRFGIVSIVIFFVVGWVILCFVDEEKGIGESRHAVVS